jgi:hypothetical protein
MKQVSNAIKSFVQSSSRHSVVQREAFSKYLLVLFLAGFAIFSSSFQKGTSISSSQKEKSVPFKGKMSLVLEGTYVSGTGTASHIGRFTIEEPNNVVQPVEGGLVITGTAIFTAANGDKIVTSHLGEVEFVNGMAHVTAEFTIIGSESTGRFAGASGTFQVLSLPNPGDYTLNGTISY